MKRRMVALCVACLLIFLGIGGRLTQLTFTKEYSQAAQLQQEYSVVVDTPRATVFDRFLQPITNTSMVWKTGVLPSSFLGEGVRVRCPSGLSTIQLAAHLVGYVNGENQGVSGLQKGYNALLQGTPTTVTYFQDATGRVLSALSATVNQDTTLQEKGVVTTLHLALQQVVEEVFPKIKKGAVVMTDCGTGQVLAGASFPSFSPLEAECSFTNTASPLLNRMLQGYDLGSVFKLCVVAAALEQGVSKGFTYCCEGSIEAGTVFSCHEEKGHGLLTMEEALAVSCNPYFIHLATTIGAKAVYDMAVALGFGEGCVLAQGVEGQAGQLPLIEELTASPAALANFAIGQGCFLATPLQVNSLTATIANGGIRYQQSLVLGTRNRKGEITYQKATFGKRVISSYTAYTLQEMMGRVMTDGTGRAGYLEGLPSGGKTSTAQTGKVNQKGTPLTNAWFTGFVPLTSPKYAITVLVEGGASGGADAAPLFREICDALLHQGL